MLHVPGDGRRGAGAEAIELARECGITLDPWQELVVEELLLERPGGQWAALETCVEVPRQNGKNVVQEAIELAGLVLFGEQLVMHSAHLFSTASEHFTRMRNLFEQVPLLAERLDAVYTANGKESLVLRGGARLRFFARSRGGGRGFSGDRLVFDEAFSLDSSALAAMMPALSARSTEVPGPQVMFFSSPAMADSAVLHNLRQRAADGAPRVAYLGWLNEPGTDPTDRDAWYRANPGLGVRISEEWVETELAAMSPEDFARERLGIPEVPDETADVFGPGRWGACQDPQSTIDGVPTFAVDVAPDMTWSSIAVAGRRTDGLWHVELVERRPGTGWVTSRLVRLAADHATGIWLDPSGPAAVLEPRLVQAGVTVRPLPGGRMAQACAAFQDAVLSGTLRHLGQGPLDAAVAGARVRRHGDLWRWARVSTSVDISPLVAVTVALAAASETAVDIVEAVW